MFDAEGDHVARRALHECCSRSKASRAPIPNARRPLLAEAEQQFRADDDDWGLGVIGFVRMETALKTGHLETAIAVGRRRLPSSDSSTTTGDSRRSSTTSAGGCGSSVATRKGPTSSRKRST